MSQWTIVLGSHTDPLSIETDDPAFAGAYAELPPQYKLYLLPDAMQWIGYRMTRGDSVVLR